MYIGSFNIGHLTIKNRIIAAPMAGISDLPFRQQCEKFGAGLTFSEMFLADKSLWDSTQSKQKLDFENINGIKATQIVGNDPQKMAETAQFNVENGAELIDINMGCPAKKVNKNLAGSALLLYPETVKKILNAVVNAVNVPVTLKIRTGFNLQNQNGLIIAKIAEDAGIKALTVHGRTRECMFKNKVSYELIKIIKQNIKIPVIANGDIINAEIAKYVFDYTKCDAIMIARSALGKPWIFKEINDNLNNNFNKISLTKIKKTIFNHIKQIHAFYGDKKGLLIARKHVLWYTKTLNSNNDFWEQFSVADNTEAQIFLLTKYLSNLT